MEDLGPGAEGAEPTDGGMPDAGGWDMSDDELLSSGEGDEGSTSDSTSETSEEAAEGEESAPPEESAAAQEGEEAEEPIELPSEPTQQELDAVPREFNAIFKVHPELQKRFYEAAGYRRLFPGGFKEAQEYSNLFGTIDDAKQAAFMASEAMAFSQDIATPSAFVKGLHSRSPEALHNLVAGFADGVGQNTPELYPLLSTPVMRMALNRAEKAATAKGDGVQQEAVQIVREMLGLTQGGGVPDQGAHGLPSQERRELDTLRTERAQFAAQEKERFESNVDSTWQQKLQGRIYQTLDNAAKKKGSSFSPGAKQIIAEQVFKAVADDLLNNSWFMASFRRALADGRRTKNADLPTAHLLAAADRYLPLRLREKLTWYTKDVLAETTAALETRQGSPRRREPGRGSAGGQRPPAPPVSPRNLDYGNTSDDAILQGKFAVRK